MKKMRILSLALAILLSMSVNSFALINQQTDTELTVSGAKTAGDDVRLKITDEKGEPVWFDSMLASSEGEFSFSVSLPINETQTVYSTFIDGKKEFETVVLADSDVLALFKAATSENVSELIKTYGKRLGFDLESYTKDNENAVNELFLQDDLSEKDKITKAFKRSIAIDKVNNADRSTLLEILEDNEDVLGFTYSEDIDALEDFQKEAFVIEMLDNTYSDFDEFKAAFADAIYIAESAEEDEDAPPKKGSSGGGGGSGGGKVSVAVPGTNAPLVNTEVQKSEKSEQTNEIFNDLKNVSWAKAHIENLYKKGVISGYGDGKFAPEISVKREEFVAMIVRMFNLKGNSGKTFSDVGENSWYKDAVTAAVDAGIINGVSETSFGVGSEISRQDCAAICERVLKYFGVEAKSAEDDFADSEKIADYAKNAVLSMKKLGIINGMDDNCFNPNGTCTRAMAAKIIDMLGGCVK